MSSWGKLNRSDDNTMEALYDEFVPARGKCDTLGGEIVRAINRLVYRYYNDGDTVAHYCGNVFNHNKAANEFLVEHCPAYKDMQYLSDLVYEDALCANLKSVLDWLIANKNVFTIHNEVDCLDNAPYEPDNDDWDDYDDDWDE